MIYCIKEFLKVKVYYVFIPFLNVFLGLSYSVMSTPPRTKSVTVFRKLRVNYRVEDGALWRDAYTVLDRVPDTAPQQVRLLEGVEVLELVFLGALTDVQPGGRGINLDTSDWQGSWVADTSAPDAELPAPVALEFRLQLEDLGEVRRLYALPPL